MAQLAICPHCETELLLTAPEEGATQRGCPNCGESFDTSEAATRFVAEAMPADGSEWSQDGSGPEDGRKTFPANSGTTLAAFLRDAEQKGRGPGNMAEDPHDETRLSSRLTVSDLDVPPFDPAPPEHEGYSDDGIEPTSANDFADFDRDWDTEEGARSDDLEEFGSFAATDDGREEGGSSFGDATDVDDGGTLKDFIVPELDAMGTTSRSENETSAVGGQEGENAQTNEVPIPARMVVRKRRSNNGTGMGTLIKIVLGGLVGIWLAYPVALWIAAYALGRSEEPMALAQYYPNIMLPERFQHGDAKKSPGNGQQFYAPPTEPQERPEENPEVLPPVEPEGPADRFAVPEGPQVVAKPVIELKEVPKYNLTDLEQATAQAAKLSPELIEGSFAQQELRRVKAGAYAGIANLAHVLACLDSSVAQHAIADSARAVFPPLFADPSDRAEITEICSHWIPSKSRKNSGILFSGTPDEGVLKGSVVEYQFQTPQGNNLTVIVPEKLDPETYGSAVTVGVAGEILYDAPAQVEGYTGDTKQAVWGAYLFPIGSP